jgi:hypothetical protein
VNGITRAVQSVTAIHPELNWNRVDDKGEEKEGTPVEAGIDPAASTMRKQIKTVSSS